MSFLTPLLLAGLPLAALPILIHLINQRRFQTVEWGAIKFLLEANRMSRGYARIRRWLILLFRTLAIAALIVAIARPLASGWLGLAGGGKVETTIVVVDRSASMGQLGGSSTVDKLSTGLAKLQETLSLVGSSRWVVIDSGQGKPQEVASPAALVKAIPTQATSAASDLVGMLEAARDYIAENRTGQTEIYILSDRRANDWNASSGRWRAIREGFLEFKQGVRFHLVAYADPADDNLAIEVTNIEQRETSDGNAALVSLKITRPTAGSAITVPVRLEIEGVASELPVELAAEQVEVVGHSLALPPGTVRGWGQVSIPLDSNPHDNQAYFAFAEPLPRRVVVVSADAAPLRAIEIAAAISPQRSVSNQVETIPPAQLAGVVWEEVALVVWHAPLPAGNDAAMLESFLDRGGQVICIPPAAAGDASFGGIAWQAWVEPPEAIAVTIWRSDSDLLARSQAGTALPVGELAIARYCKLAGDHTPLATLGTGDVLLTRAIRDSGGLYFLATSTATADSTLAVDGIVLYVALQRAIAAGAESLGSTRQLVAGQIEDSTAATWQPLATDENVLSSEYPLHSGVYAAGERLLAVNRPAGETHAGILSEKQVEDLFAGLDFDQISDSAGDLNALSREIWRIFLTGMIAALVIEAALCVPKPRGEGGRA